MTNNCSSQLALELLKVMGFVIPAVALIIAFIGRVTEEFHLWAIVFAFVAFFLIILATMIDILFIVWSFSPFYFYLSSALFVASLLFLGASIAVLLPSHLRRL